MAIAGSCQCKGAKEDEPNLQKLAKRANLTKQTSSPASPSFASFCFKSLGSEAFSELVAGRSELNRRARCRIAERKCEVFMKEPSNAAAVRVFPPAVPLLTILIGVALNCLCPFKLKLSALSRYGIGGAIIGAAVLGLGLYPVILLRQSGQSENPWTPTTEIVTRGPYRFTRNPLYLQMVLACIGFAILVRNIWILLLTPLCAWALQILAIVPEEAYLERKFGESYGSYKRRVRRWL